MKWSLIYPASEKEKKRKKNTKIPVQSTYAIGNTGHTSANRRSLLQFVQKHLFVLLFKLSSFNNNICGADNPRFNSSLDQDSTGRKTSDGEPQRLSGSKNKNPLALEVLDQHWSEVNGLIV